MTLRNALMLCLSLCSLATASVSQADDHVFELGQALPDGRITAEVPSDTELTLTLRGVWRDACLPALSGFAGSGHRRLLTLDAGLPGRVCAQVLTPFALEIPGVRFDVEEAGVVEVALVESGAGWLSTNTLSVQPAIGARSRVSLHDVAGAWSDVATPGSGLFLSHDRSGDSDRVAGGWMNFGPDGYARSHLLADARWATPTQLLGVVYRARTTPFACTLQFPNHECDFGARAAESIDAVAVFELRMLDADTAVLTMGDPAFQGVPPPGAAAPAVTGYSILLRRL